MHFSQMCVILQKAMGNAEDAGVSDALRKKKKRGL